MNYRYYSTQRPIMPGSYPKPEGNGIVTVYNFDNKNLCRGNSERGVGLY